MSCHYRLLNKRKAAAENAEKAVQSDETEAPKEEIKVVGKPAKKASKGRRKVDA